MNKIDIVQIMTSAQAVYALLVIVFLLYWIAFHRQSSRKNSKR